MPHFFQIIEGNALPPFTLFISSSLLPLPITSGRSKGFGSIGWVPLHTARYGESLISPYDILYNNMHMAGNIGEGNAVKQEVFFWYNYIGW